MSHATSSPRSGHEVQLLQGSGELFPALVEAIDAAQREVRLETYIFDFTGSAELVVAALLRAGERGVSVKVVVDGFGTPPLGAGQRERLHRAGVGWRVYAPLGWLGMLWLGSWRRLHRKLCVVDGAVAFCGGINILDDLHDPNHGPLAAPRLDFAVRVTGPLVAEAEASMGRLWWRMQAVRDIRQARLGVALDALRASQGGRARRKRYPSGHSQPRARAALLLRDNLRNRARIERAYRRAIGRAREEIIIANAYFVPGRKMRLALIAAAGRGVKVRLLLQGRYEYFMQYYAARPVYGALLRAGVEIHEYSPSFLHAKVAVIDGRWSTVGSSNLDPLSLLLAREANVVVEDRPFAEQLRQRLMVAIRQEGRAMSADEYGRRPLRQRFMEHVALALMRLALVIQGKKYL
ncbi:cardiolipin synthase ClsB [Ramlibacter sp.]|uniref:cardiolipin synthase ClsB n=1 Tax=Ramlibacter sp. TaxID=1917967 RepID=UPI002BF7C19E|nr:cardiolipin synthase ClsB [Ramlibacter sp.]HWI82885.1 cardiolipin synthase ClsB [Ramlibacter sp.]